MANSSHGLTNERLLLPLLLCTDNSLGIGIQLLPPVTVCTDTASGISTVTANGKGLYSGTSTVAATGKGLCTYILCTTTATINVDTGVARLTVTDTMLVPVLDPRHRCTLVLIPVLMEKALATYTL